VRKKKKKEKRGGARLSLVPPRKEGKRRGLFPANLEEREGEEKTFFSPLLEETGRLPLLSSPGRKKEGVKLPSDCLACFSSCIPRQEKRGNGVFHRWLEAGGKEGEGKGPGRLLFL